MQVIICEVYAYEADSVDEAIAAVNEANEIRETPVYVIGAETLDELGAPVQNEEIRNAFAAGATDAEGETPAEPEE